MRERDTVHVGERSNNEECLLILITRKEVHPLLIDGNQTGVLHPDIADPPPHAAGTLYLVAQK